MGTFRVLKWLGKTALGSFGNVIDVALAIRKPSVSQIAGAAIGMTPLQGLGFWSAILIPDGFDKLPAAEQNWFLVDMLREIAGSVTPDQVAMRELLSDACFEEHVKDQREALEALREALARNFRTAKRT